MQTDYDDSDSGTSENTAIQIAPTCSAKSNPQQQMVSIEDFNKVAIQVKEMTQMIANLTQTVQLLTAEVKRKSDCSQCSC